MEAKVRKAEVDKANARKAEVDKTKARKANVAPTDGGAPRGGSAPTQPLRLARPCMTLHDPA